MLNDKVSRVKKTERRRPNADDADRLSIEGSLIFCELFDQCSSAHYLVVCDLFHCISIPTAAIIERR